MPLIRWNNRAVTAITPHAGNRRVLIPPYKGTSTPPAVPNWTTDPPAVPDGDENVPYSYNLAADLNTTIGVAITVTAGALPDGLSISGTNIVGTPTTPGTFSGIQLTATNVSGSDQSLPFDVTIAGIPQPTALRFDNPVQSGKEVLDQGTEVFSLTAPGVSGDIEPDGQVTIVPVAAEQFGNIGPTLAIYDDFRNGVNGQNIGLADAVIGTWTDYTGATVRPEADNSQSLSGGLSAKVVDSRLGSGARGLRIEWTPSTEFFVSYWWRSTQNWQGIQGGKAKMTWLNDNVGGDNYQNDDYYDLCFPNRNTNSDWNIQGNDGYRKSDLWTDRESVANTWHRASWWERDNTPDMDFMAQRLTPGQWHDETTAPDANRTNMFSDIFPLSSSVDRCHFPGFVDTSSGFWPADPAIVWYECIYLAYGAGAAARVEIGDNAVYSACTRLAIATVDSWANGQIVCTLRDAGFGDFDNQFMHIHDADNNYIGSSRAIT